MIALTACAGEGEALIDSGLPGDGGVDADLRCTACTADQICVQKFGGTCTPFQVECQDRAPTCTGTSCTPDCNFYHCNGGSDAGILTCAAASCPGELPGALHCFGP